MYHIFYLYSTFFAILRSFFSSVCDNVLSNRIWKYSKLQILKGDIIELATLFNGFYGLKRSEIIGLRKTVFNFDENYFIINHVAIQNDGKDNEEKVYFKDKPKSKKGYRAFPLFEPIRDAVLRKLERIEENKKIFGNSYNHKYDGYLFAHDNGDII